MIKVKVRSEKDIMIRCNTKQEKQFVLGIFLEMKSQPRMEDKIIVKGIDGREMRLRKPVSPEPEVKPFVEGVQQEGVVQTGS
ncbi:MAG: hypothetical protein IMZ52_01595 [Actinobacteria bacterium]|nr:hypothetical protein [Actinomycetota bacterium]MBE3114824.1 hypothetical protein [Actinomycetota bacterium]